ncbi:unnamed protein product, partial [Polarella glacialis]
ASFADKDKALAAAAAESAKLRVAEQTADASSAALEVMAKKVLALEKACADHEELRAKIKDQDSKLKDKEDKRRLVAAECEQLQKELKAYKEAAKKQVKKSDEEDAEKQKLRQMAENAKVEAERWKKEALSKPTANKKGGASARPDQEAERIDVE